MIVLESHLGTHNHAHIGCSVMKFEAVVYA